MRILHSVHDYLPEQVAGVEVYTSRLIASQSESDEVGLLFAHRDADRESGDWAKSDIGGVRSFEVVQNRDWSSFEQTWLDERLAPAFRSALADFRPDVLHVQHLMNLGLGLIDACLEMRVPIVMTLHDHWWSCANGGQRFRLDRARCDTLDAKRCSSCTWSQVGPALALKRWIVGTRADDSTNGDDGHGARIDGPQISDRALRAVRVALARHAPTPLGRMRIERRWQRMRKLGSQVGRFVAPSKDLANAATEFGFPADRISLLPHGFERRDHAVRRSESEYARRFVYVGSVVPHKGIHCLIRAFNALPLDASLSIHGSLASDPAYVRELHAEATHPGIRFFGSVQPDRVASVLEEADCLVAPSIWRENAPLIIQEAFLEGTPVIATDIGGHRELLTRGGGLLVPPEDEDALHASLARLVTERNLAASLSRSAPEVGDLGEHVAALKAIYEAVARP